MHVGFSSSGIDRVTNIDIISVSKRVNPSSEQNLGPFLNSSWWCSGIVFSPRITSLLFLLGIFLLEDSVKRTWCQRNSAAWTVTLDRSWHLRKALGCCSSVVHAIRRQSLKHRTWCHHSEHKMRHIFLVNKRNRWKKKWVFRHVCFLPIEIVS